MPDITPTLDKVISVSLDLAKMALSGAVGWYLGRRSDQNKRKRAFQKVIADILNGQPVSVVPKLRILKELFHENPDLRKKQRENKDFYVTWLKDPLLKARGYEIADAM